AVLLLSVIATAAGLAIAEGALRIFKLWVIPDYSAMNWYRKAPIPNVPYFLKPNLHAEWGLGRVNTDDFGTRNTHSSTRTPGVRRILLLGDSVTFGYGVDQTQSFPAALETLLNKGTTKYEVINAGVPGFSIRDEAALLPSLIQKYSPDVVMWIVVSNDY